MINCNSLYATDVQGHLQVEFRQRNAGESSGYGAVVQLDETLASESADPYAMPGVKTYGIRWSDVCDSASQIESEL